MAGVLPSRSAKAAFAPCQTVSYRLANAALCSGVWPVLSRMSTVAPASNNSEIHSGLLCSAGCSTASLSCFERSRLHAESARKQKLQALRAVENGGQHQRRPAKLVLSVNSSAVVQKQPCAIQAVHLDTSAATPLSSSSCTRSAWPFSAAASSGLCSRQRRRTPEAGARTPRGRRLAARYKGVVPSG